jgi:hypothetical protein
MDCCCDDAVVEISAGRHRNTRLPRQAVVVGIRDWMVSFSSCESTDGR